MDSRSGADADTAAKNGEPNPQQFFRAWVGDQDGLPLKRVEGTDPTRTTLGFTPDREDDKRLDLALDRLLEDLEQEPDVKEG